MSETRERLAELCWNAADEMRDEIEGRYNEPPTFSHMERADLLREAGALLRQPPEREGPPVHVHPHTGVHSVEPGDILRSERGQEQVRKSAGLSRPPPPEREGMESAREIVALGASGAGLTVDGCKVVLAALDRALPPPDAELAPMGREESGE